MPIRFATAACLSLALVAAACAEPSDRDRIRAVLEDGVRALEDGRPEAARHLLADDYRDDAGRDAATIVGIARVALAAGPVTVFLVDPSIRIDGDRARVEVDAYALQSSARVEKATDLVPKDARRFALAVRLRRDGRDWKVTAIDGDGIPAAPF